MATAKLNFDLNDSQDRIEFARATKAFDMASALHQMAANTKKSLKWEIESEGEKNNLSQEVIDAQADTLDKVFNRFNEILEKYDINLDKLIV